MLVKQNNWATVWWKNYDVMLSRFHLIPERNGQTDRQTDGRKDLLYQYRASVWWRGIKTKKASHQATRLLQAPSLCVLFDEKCTAADAIFFSNINSRIGAPAPNVGLSPHTRLIRLAEIFITSGCTNNPYALSMLSFATASDIELVKGQNVSFDKSYRNQGVTSGKFNIPHN